MKGGIASWPPMLFPADARTQLIDRRSGRWRARNVAKRPGEGVDDRQGNHHPTPFSPVRCCWTVSRRRERMDAQNSAVKIQTWSARGGLDRPDTGYGRAQARRRPWPDDRPTSQCSFLFPIEQTEAASFALLGRCNGVTRVITSRRKKHLPLLSPTYCPLFRGIHASW